ncbi:fibrinogen-like YCDxxxxGGGW domain-containing protein [Allohahella marinimesophila]|uniref:Fibrinogen C-terminal domain-containing protein n=1 Tax=Allohahella marinimesophila TaxID=1054972 RepID=A0ABP7PVW2_9GAMM
MKMHNNNLRKVWRSAVVAGIGLVAEVVSAESVCDAILSQGIRDFESHEYSSLQHSVAQRTYCESEAKNDASQASFLYGDYQGAASTRESTVNQLCDETFQASFHNQQVRSLVKAINSGIVKAWGQCIDRNKVGLSHYFEVVDDTRFLYVMDYYSSGDGDPTTDIISWNIDSGKCNDEVPTTIGASSFRTLCTRDDRYKKVVITATASVGGRDLDPIILPAVIDPPPPSTARSCNQLDKTRGNGIYTIDPDGKDYGVAPFQVYCDMSREGGGWTLFAHHRDNINPVRKLLILPDANEFGIMPDAQWQALVQNLKDGMMFVDEHNNVSMIGKAKLQKASCKNLSQVASLEMNHDKTAGSQHLMHAET